MITSNSFFQRIHDLTLQNKIFSIAGASSTGKTTLMLQLISNFLTDTGPNQFCCLWIQASESFPKKRLQKMLELTPDKLNKVLNNIFVIPSNQTCKNYEAQKKIINNITENNISLPPNLKYIVIDNISHHLRYDLSRCSDFQSSISFLNEFFNSQLYPLIMFCDHNDITLFLIHEVSYDPKLGKNKVFCQRLYERIKCVKIFLDLNKIMQSKTISIEIENKKYSFNYQINDLGIKLI